MDEDLRLVVEREHLLLQADVRRDTERVLSLLHPDFTEYGASGHVWDRTSIAEATSSSTDNIAMSDVGARRLGADAVLLTYRSNAAGRHALRSSTWVRESGGWLLLFHQGRSSPVRSAGRSRPAEVMLPTLPEFRQPVLPAATLRPRRASTRS